MPRVLAVIPARLASTRLARKVLLDDTGKPLIQHVHQSVAASKTIERVVIATDSPEVIDACQSFGAEAMMTSPDCASGTDRVAEVASRLTDYEIILNVQGDEPEMDPSVLDALVEAMTRSDAPMGTVATPWPEELPLESPGAVKVVTNGEGFALYFSRSVIPHLRDGESEDRSLYRKHVGLYAYRSDFLQQFASLPPSPLELAESLEQLRALESGASILVVEVEYEGCEINTPQDYAAFVKRAASGRI